MKRKVFSVIIVVGIIVVFGWIVQDFTGFKIFDYAKDFLEKIKLSSFGLPSATPIPGKQLNIFIRDVGFVPNNSGLEAGGRVSWYNEDSRSHIVAGDNWVSPEIKPGQTFSKVFEAPGVYRYHCPIYPEMTGQFTVCIRP